MSATYAEICLSIAKEEINEDPNILSFNKDYGTNEELVLLAVGIYHGAICYASKKLQENRNFILKAVKKNGLVLDYVSQEFKDDEEVVRAAIKQNPKAIFSASERLRKNPP